MEDGSTEKEYSRSFLLLVKMEKQDNCQDQCNRLGGPGIPERGNKRSKLYESPSVESFQIKVCGGSQVKPSEALKLGQWS